MDMGFESDVRIIDTATPFVMHASRYTPRYIDRALASVGWWLGREIRASIKAGRPGGQPFEPFSRIKRTWGRQTRMAYIERERGRHTPLGKLGNAVRYRRYKDSHRVIIGWLSGSAERLGLLHERGTTYPITRAMRALYAFSDIPLSGSKREIVIPKRESIGPEYRQHGREVTPYIERKIWEYLQEAPGR